MIRIKILLSVLLFISHAFCEDENSTYYYIDTIDKIKDLDEVSNKYLILGDTLNAINTLIEISTIAEFSEMHSDDFISDYFYRIGNLFLLINDNRNAEKYFLLSINRYNETKIRNQLLMHDPLLGLEKLYQEDSLKLKTISKQINAIKELEDFTIPDSLKYDMVSFNSFNQNIDIESEYFIYNQIDIASSEFYNGLYAQSVENLMNSLLIQVENVTLDYYYNLDILDSINFEYLYPAFELQSKDIDTLNNHRGYFFMSMINSKLDNPNEAIHQITQYNIYNKNDSKGYELLGDIYFSINNWPDAFFQYYRTLLNNQDDLNLKLKISKCFIKEHYYQNAVTILNQIINSDIYFEEAYYELGKLYLLLENYNLANENLTQSLLLNPNNKDAYYYLGLSYLRINKYNFALDSFNKVILLDELYGDAYYYLGLIFESILDYEKAVIHYKKAKHYGSMFKDLNIKYGGLLYNLNYFQEAINPLKDYLLEHGDQIDVLIMIGDIFYTEMRYDESINIYNKLTIESPENIFYKNRLANSFYQLQSYERAINIYKEILIDNSEDISIMKKLGNIYYELENYEEAINYYSNVIECDGGDKELFYNIALSYIQIDKFLQSLIAFKKASIYDPDNQVIQYQIGVTYTELELYEQALHYFRNYNLNDPDSKFMEGFCYYKLNNYNDAISAFNSYLNLKKDSNIEVDYYKGLCYYFLKNFKNAAKHLKIVTKNDTENIEALYYLGRSYLQLNKKREAKKIVNKLYYLNINYHDSLNRFIK